MKEIVILGSGNLATSLAQALHHTKFYQVVQIYSPNIIHAQQLAQLVKSDYTNLLDQLHTHADIYFIVTVDSSIEQLALYLSKHITGTVIHCSGCTPLNALSACTQYGVLYLLQTFSKQQAILDFSEIPGFIESNCDNSKQEITQICSALNVKPTALDSEQRSNLHLAAAITCNFTNHLLSLAFDILKENKIDFNYIRPLMYKTLDKAFSGTHPRDLQTGPAIRNDQKTLDLHTVLMDTRQELYTVLSKSIQTYHKKIKNE